ncbi:hypothetical protein ACE38W_06955 [Chitinophaga sp. Hz27]|uniref:hypothetical protein n=1 Tax=Chitinophaga sp. Hz27 TaxID=3347169 RepID=UPI0035D6D14E
MKNYFQSSKKPSLKLNKITVIALDKTEMGKVWGGATLPRAAGQSTRPECDVTNSLPTSGAAG